VTNRRVGIDLSTVRYRSRGQLSFHTTVSAKKGTAFAMTECGQSSFGFEALGTREVVARFDGGMISSDGGAFLLRQTDLRLNPLPRLAGCFLDGDASESEAAVSVGDGICSDERTAPAGLEGDGVGSSARFHDPHEATEDRRADPGDGVQGFGFRWRPVIHGKDFTSRYGRTCAARIQRAS
jgi:hypothetical protein